jgi:type II secretion system protein E
MSNASTEYLAGLLERMELFSPAQVVELIEAARESEMSVTEIVTAEGYAPEEAFLEKLAEVMRRPYVRLNTREIEQDVLDRLPTKAVFLYNVIPVEFENGALLVASNDPLDAGLVDSLRLAAGGRVKLALSPSTDIAKAAKRFYGVGAETVDRMMQDDRFEVAVDESLAKVDVTELDQEASIVKFVNQIIWEAVQQGSTDIHMEPMEAQLRIRYRVDGVLHQAPVPARLIRFQAAIISRIKVMANLDIAEKRMPMDGRIGLRVQGEDIDIRVSTMPTVYGESVSLRLLQRKGEFISLEDLGMTPRDKELVERNIHRPNGIVLVTGPTGSGKSTTLYAFLHEINKIDRRILTAEEPIEYEMGGINQVLVRPDIGLTFAHTLRSFLRQDPDIIMVGEIRDAETAEIAIQASLTGHLVFSTLHTNDAAGSFTRLLDMGVEPFLVASAVAGVVAQRLVRRLCPDCRKVQTPDMARLERVGFPMEQLADRTVYEPSTCEACRMTGFHGRGGIFEVLNVSEAIESLVVARSSSHDIRQLAMNEGMPTLRDDGWQKVLKGFTTIEEILRVTEENLVEQPDDEQSKDEHSMVP